MAKLSTLADMFETGTLNTSRWNASSASPNVQVDPALDRVAVACTASYYSLGSTAWDATESIIYARVVPAPPGSGSTETILEVLLDASNKASFFVSGGVFYARVINAGTSTTTQVAATYDAYSYAWWRIAETAGQFVFATSPDAYTWTTRASIAHSWAATAVKAQFVSGFFGSESAGMSAYIDHVNTTSSAPDQPNLNWPRIEDGWAPFWGANNGGFPADRFVEVTDRTRGSVGVQRGRQYETDQVRSGEASLRLANTDAVLDPVNASGPWYGHIAPYQPYRRRAQWPPTRNLLDQVMATGGDLGGFSGTIVPGTSDIFSNTDGSGGTFTTTATAWQGSTVMQFAVPSATMAPTRICHTPRWSPIPGQAYTVQLRVRDVTASTSLSVQAHIGWYTAGGGSTPTSFNYGTSSTLTGSATAGWTQVTITATAPANAAGMDIGVAVAATAAAACTVQVDGVQLEKGATATTWQAPGVWFPVYAGWTERWPSRWDMAGQYAVVEPTAVDTFSLLSQRQLSDPLTQEINNRGARFVYKLDDPAGSTSATDWTGTYPAIPIGISKYGAGSLTFGNSITATDPVNGVYTGSTSTVCTVTNSNPGTNLITGGASFLRLTNAGITGPTDPTLWVRAIAFRYTGPTPTSNACMWSWMDNQRANNNPSGSHVYVFIDNFSKPVLSIQGPTGAGTSYYPAGATNVVDGNWHFLIFGYNASTQQVLFSQDGVSGFYSSVPTTYTPSGIVADNLGGFVDATVGNGTTNNFKGDIAFACEFTTWFPFSTHVTNLYAAWKSACAGESTNARYARILNYAGYTGTSNLDTGLTTSMGAATFDGQDAVSALQAVVDTEAGAHYVDASGTIVFKSRSARYNALTPMYTFGERTDLGEWPYEDCTLDYDSTHLSNQVTVTQDGTGQQFYATDPTSVTSYFARPLTRTINSSSADECNDAANYLLSRYRQPAQRVSSLKLHPSANPALWPVCLALELGTRARVMRRPPGVPAIEVDCFIENLAWDFGDDGDAWLTIQCSPADLTSYGLFAAWHTLLNTTIASGVTSITVKAPADNVNPLAAQIAPGQQLVLGQGTANAETVTVLTVGASSSGWTTATLTLTAATAKAHTANDVICEPLPAGTTDPTTWDAVAMFDSIAFAY